MHNFSSPCFQYPSPVRLLERKRLGCMVKRASVSEFWLCGLGGHKGIGVLSLEDLLSSSQPPLLLCPHVIEEAKQASEASLGRALISAPSPL